MARRGNSERPARQTSRPKEEWQGEPRSAGQSIPPLTPHGTGAVPSKSAGDRSTPVMPVPVHSVKTGETSPRRQRSPLSPNRKDPAQTASSNKDAVPLVRRSQGSQLRQFSDRWRRRLLNWKTLLIFSFIACGGSAALALAYIFQLPGLPNCPAVFWPLASASMRFECARIAASKQTAKDLLEAITLVDGLPADHAMREEANRLVELWSQEVLKLAEESFQAGKLKEAIDAARKIPARVTAHQLVEEQIKRWQTIWAAAEKAYQTAEAAMKKRQWRQAFQSAIELLNLDNRYWQTTKYDELTNRINTARIDGNKLYEAERLADDGGLANLLEAVKLAEQIRPESDIYPLAQAKIKGFGRKMLALAEETLERKNLQEAIAIVNKIPKNAKLEEEIKDFTILANAQSQAWLDTVVNLEAAISQAQRIQPKRPLYKKAQQWITRWQYSITGLAQLERARLLVQARGGNLEAAIAAASLISPSNPRYREAQTQIQSWQSEIQVAQDRPVLDQAEQLALPADVASLQAAINQATQITSGRALYKEAQGRIQQWTSQIQQIQDQPYLDQARAYADAGNLRTAIKIIEQIRSGRSLYNEAQTAAAPWRKQIQAEVDQAQAQSDLAQAQRTLQEARQIASVGLPASLANAIQLANQINRPAALRSEAATAVNEWSLQLLQLAQQQATSNPAAAIAIAQRIPSGTPAHLEAQTQIATWQKMIPVPIQ
ncbi:chromosome segregation ATPase [Phormidium sp. CLA17]|uniref:chromosome segregation ATPase n=1 Tax=Leptolyngbya sp. Cla-17 TaxID=2803751 RepID=UPI001491005F|nr:chromosome segregation ATPase [Leptolyngbya sp. Cla-17]MBM0744192.1 chromosome segregation ATPase [Leptolyngbya sp. Cla-17]